MKQLRMPLRVVFYREGDDWIAHCLELDLIGHGHTKDDALNLLYGAIATQVEASIKHNSLNNLFSPADKAYFAMFAAGKDVTSARLELEIGQLLIEDVTAREYSDSDADVKMAFV